MHKLESVLAKETHKILWDFEMQTDPLTPARISDLVMINKNNNNKESEKRDKYLDLTRELRNLTNTWVIKYMFPSFSSLITVWTIRTELHIYSEFLYQHKLGISAELQVTANLYSPGIFHCILADLKYWGLKGRNSSTDLELPPPFSNG